MNFSPKILPPHTATPLPIQGDQGRHGWLHTPQIEFDAEMHFNHYFLLDSDETRWFISIFTSKLTIHDHRGAKTAKIRQKWGKIALY